MIVYDHFGGEIVRTVNHGVLHQWNVVDGVDDFTHDPFATWAPEKC
jgi:hypothetical protein